MPARVVMYRTRMCAYCVAAKLLLERRKIGYEEVDVSRDPEARRRLLESSGRRTVPQIFIDDRPIGGFLDLYELDRRGLLSQMIGA